jgi:hypothetical protein
LHEIRRLSVAIVEEEEWIASKERITRDGLASFDALQKERMGSILLELEESGDRR